jgi:hypothetical protein
VPEGTLSKKEGYLGLRSTLNLPRFGKVSNKTIEVSVIFDQPIEDEGVDVA